MFDVLLYAKQIIPPYIRINILQRDFPEESNKRAGFKSENIRSNLRQQLLARMKHMGKRCECIRCREVKNKEVEQKNVKLIVRSYRASEGIEYFISYEDVTQDIFGFIRLRILIVKIKKRKYLVLSNAALVRELHVYGMMKPTTKDKSQAKLFNIMGGKKLLKKAEQITKNHELNKVLIISGVGVRNYYRKFGYKLKETW